MPADYWSYLRLPSLLALQDGLEADESAVSPDELCFIVVHQVFELWFKLILNEVRLARRHLGAERVPEEDVPMVVHHLARVNRILEVAGDHFRVVETLSPQDFLAFRDRLFGASGFQSVQMRELELVLGLDEAERMAAVSAHMSESPVDRLATDAAGRPDAAWIAERLRAARAEPSLLASLLAWLARTPIDGSAPGDPDDAEQVGAFVEGFLAAQAAHQAGVAGEMRAAGVPEATLEARFGEARAMAERFLRAEDVEPADAAERARLARARAGLLFIESYRELPLLSWPRLLLDRVVELEELMLLWRTRHVRMVERVIGRRAGTGGSAGVDYLERTTRYRIFKDLWTVRTLLLPRSALPPLRRPEAYDFALGTRG